MTTAKQNVFLYSNGMWAASADKQHYILSILMIIIRIIKFL